MNPPDRHLLTLHGIHAMRASHPAARRLKRQQPGHSAHGNKVWLSSFVLLDYLHDNPPPTAIKAMDLGCGWGFSSVFLAKKFAAEVTAVDLDGSLQRYVELQCQLNQTEVTFKRGRFQQLTARELGQHHTIIGADICFWDSLAEVLYKLIRRALRGGTVQIILADPGRPPFWALVEQVASELEGYHDATVEVLSRRLQSPLKTEKYLLTINR